MSFVIDTCAYSAFLRDDPRVITPIESASGIHVPIVVLGELRAGFHHGNRVSENEMQLQDFLASPRVQVVSIDEATTHHYASLYATLRRLGKKIPNNDLWIAASAMRHNLPLLTIDRHFEVIPMPLVPLSLG